MSSIGVRRGRAGAQGFVLVGVVMMVLALTIIGVSLYSLSGYDSQFFGRSRFERQALYAASGGVEMVKVLLTTPQLSYRLSNASRAVGRVIGRDTIVTAVAWQTNPDDSTGPIQWGKPVHIRVGASVNGAARTVTGSFTPRQPDNPYWRLFTSAAPVQFLPGVQRTLRARGGAWHPVQSAADSAWIRALHTESRIALTTAAPPAASISSFINDHYPPPGSADTARLTRDGPGPLSYATVTLTMDAGPGANDYKFFRSESDLWTVSQGLLPIFSYVTDANTHVRVRGTAIWILPKGAYFIGEFRVQRYDEDDPANLIIVAAPNGLHPLYPLSGTWFSKGIWTPDDDVNVFVVSSGSVLIDDLSISPDDIEARHLSVLAQNIRLSGPALGTHTLRLEYAPELKSVASDLYGRGLLPPIPGMTMQSFERVAGSWTAYPGLQ